MANDPTLNSLHEAEAILISELHNTTPRPNIHEGRAMRLATASLWLSGVIFDETVGKAARRVKREKGQ